MSSCLDYTIKSQILPSKDYVQLVLGTNLASNQLQLQLQLQEERARKTILSMLLEQQLQPAFRGPKRGSELNKIGPSNKKLQHSYV